MCKRSNPSISIPTPAADGEGSTIHYPVVLDRVAEPGWEGYYYAYIPALDVTTQGTGIEGALAAARDLAELWVAEKRTRAESAQPAGETERK